MVTVIIIEHIGTFIVFTPILRGLRNVAHDFLTVRVQADKPVKLTLCVALWEEPAICKHQRARVVALADPIFLILAKMLIEASIVSVRITVTMVFNIVTFRNRTESFAHKLVKSLRNGLFGMLDWTCRYSM